MPQHRQSRCPGEFARLDVTAEPAVAAQLRRDFAAWLQNGFTLDETKASDMVLAVNEALANAAEFAYVTADVPGAMHLRAEYDTAAAVLTVTVADDGRWRATDPSTRSRTRGRGIPLMQALADRVTIDPSSHGTRVCLEWNQILAAGPAKAEVPAQ